MLAIGSLEVACKGIEEVPDMRFGVVADRVILE